MILVTGLNLDLDALVVGSSAGFHFIGVGLEGGCKGGGLHSLAINLASLALTAPSLGFLLIHLSKLRISAGFPLAGSGYCLTGVLLENIKSVSCCFLILAVNGVLETRNIPRSCGIINLLSSSFIFRYVQIRLDTWGHHLTWIVNILISSQFR